MPEAYSYFQTLPPASRSILREVSAWRWVASHGEGLATPVDHPEHARWIAHEGNLHRPPHREIQFVLEGGGHFSHQGRVFERRTGTVFLFDHHESRDWIRAPHNLIPHTALWLHFIGGGRPWLTYNTVSLDKSGRQQREIAHRLYSNPAVADLIAAWDRHLALPGARLPWEQLKAMTTTLLLDLLRLMAKAPTESGPPRIVRLISLYIAEHLGEDLSLTTLARVMGYSPFFFHRLFRRETGRTLKEYVDTERFRAAQERLLQGWSVSAVAESLGMSSPYAFSRFFARHAGMPPTRWADTQR